MKKSKIIASLLIVFVILTFIYSEPKIKLQTFYKNILSSPLFKDSTVLDSDAYYGILHDGNNERYNYHVTLLIKSSSTKEELLNYYKKMSESFYKPNDLINRLQWDSPQMLVDVSNATRAPYVPYFASLIPRTMEQPYSYCSDTIASLKDLTNIYYICIRY